MFHWNFRSPDLGRLELILLGSSFFNPKYGKINEKAPIEKGKGKWTVATYGFNP